MKRIIARVLPMVLIDYAFTDIVVGQPVYHFRERLTGRKVLANSPWSLFRVECKW